MDKQSAIEYFGSQAKLAKALGVTRQAVNLWPEKIPIGRAYQIEVITNGELKAEQKETAAA